MKRLFCFLLSFFLLAMMCACKQEFPVSLKNDNPVPSVPRETIASTEPDQQETPTTDPMTEPQVTESEIIEPATQPVTEPITEPVTEPATEAVKPTEAPVTDPPANMESGVLEYSHHTYTVTDPENIRQLSTISYGFSYGVAKDGKPHSQSIINQENFDAYPNVEALALDTKSSEKTMYLTFDNGYEYENLTADILDTLMEKGVRAAFFVTLSYVKSNPQLVRRMIDEGHIVGNHSTNHPSFPTLTRTEMAEEIAQLDNYLREHFGYSSPYFRFPSGEYSECALELVTSLDFRSIFWSVAYADWDTSTQKGSDYALETVTSRFHSGAVILLHAVSRDNAQALGDIIDAARAQGYTLKTLDEYPGF